MDRINSRIAQVYGYAVCFIAVIAMLFSIKQVFDAAIDLSDPVRAGGGFGRMGRPMTNFEVYKMAVRREQRFAPMQGSPVPARANSDTLSDVDLRKMYDAEREDAIGNAKFRASRSLVGNLLLIILAGVLFGIHWRWLKQRDAAPVAP